MLLRQESGDGVAVLRLSGPASDADAARLVRTVRNAQAAQPRGVVVDLSRTTSLAPAAAHALTALVEPGSGRSSLGVCGPADVQAALPELVVHERLEDAVAALDDRRCAPRESVSIQHSVHGPAEARRAVQECAERLGMEEEGDDLVLVVSEMVTNAVRHGAPPVELQIAAAEDRVVVAVSDGSAAPPVPRTAGEEAEGGRGMALVDLLCDDHGVRPDPPGKKVWAAVRRRKGRAAS